MKKFFFGTACAIFIPCGINLLEASFNSTAYALDDSKMTVCEIPPTRPTGGNTLARMLAIQLCEQPQLKNQQTLTTPVRESDSSSAVPSSTRQNQDSNEKLDGVNTRVCKLPTDGSTGGSIQVKQQCNLVR
ncbi:hypothetical protein [Calothrix sp. PCC 7507]|uniref:hypothetical protein n=1 Tax=Calothrix sp. PCC 7507 TaxID=99598 RepID=UPI00029ED4E9|nr:hypothetical protein [Calothrix sp. PCC 7507]AFY34154.1 hypothetical protein Cal7507_3764 [Calothrix sp. PCC 7507]